MRIFLLLLICTAFQLNAQQDYRSHCNISASYAYQVAYGEHNLFYSFKSPLIAKRFHVQLDAKAYHLSNQVPVYLVGKYNQFNLSADFNLTLTDNFTIFPFGGIQFAVDLSHQTPGQLPITETFGIAAIFGVRGMYFHNKWVLFAELAATPYIDGWWLEFRPQIGYDIYKGLCLHLGVNLAAAFVQSNTSLGTYPYIGINYYIPIGKQ